MHHSHVDGGGDSGDGGDGDDGTKRRNDRSSKSVEKGMGGKRCEQKRC